MKLSPRIKNILKLALFILALMTLFRCIFFVVFLSKANEFTGSEARKAFYLGLKFDVRVTLSFLLPYFLLSWLPAFNPERKVKARKLWTLFYTVVSIFTLLTYALDLGYYAYLNGRLNATVVTFLYNPMDSFLMMWQSYPLHVIIGFILFLGFIVYWILKNYIFNQMLPVRFSSRERVTSFLLVFIFVTAGLYGKISFYPLRWSEAFFSSNSFVSSLALNPIHYFFDTLRNRETDYDIKKVKKYYPLVADYLQIPNKNADELNFERPIRQTPMFKEKPNVVVIVMESLAAFKTGILGSPLKPTPYLDDIARRGKLFTRFYVPSEGTARSMFGLISGVPDLGSQRTSSRNPLIVNQNTIVNAFTNYEKLYFIGGSANWGNIRGVISNNIKDINIFEEGDFKSGRTDVWGLSDLQLFEESFNTIKERHIVGRPFFALIQAASFHRPYTIPEERGNFQEVEVSDEEAKKYGFISSKEFNSLRFSDYALGTFLHQMGKDPAFDNTVFAIIGDHGLPDNNAINVTPGENIYNFSKFHVPLVIYSKKLKPETIDIVASEPDVLPTLAGMTGHNMTNKAFGRNLFAKGYRRYAFHWFYYQKPPTFGLITNNLYLKAQPGNLMGLYKFNSKTPEYDWKDINPKESKYLNDLAQGLYETGKYMLYHNKNSLNKDQTEK